MTDGFRTDPPASIDAHKDDRQQPSIETVQASLPPRSGAEPAAVDQAPTDGDDGALLGLEPSGTEKAGENAPLPDQGLEPGPHPLLGTSTSESIEILGKSSARRSSERGCYGFLLRFGAHSRGLTSGKVVRNGPRGCYGFHPTAGSYIAAGMRRTLPLWK
jgi:hypothetical protein